MKLERLLRKFLRISGDVKSIKRGTYGKRVARREVRKAMRRSTRKFK